MSGVLFIFSCLYVVLILGRLNLPLQGDETTHLVPYGSIVGFHPPFFYLILGSLTNFFHLGGVQLRLLGIICFIITLLLTYFLTKTVSKDEPVSILAALLFALSPLAIQGSLLIEIDNTVLTVSLMLFLLYFAACYDNLKLKDCLILGILLFLGLFSKLSTPFALIISMFIFYALTRQWRQAISRVFLISLIGSALFLLAWWVSASYYKLPFGAVFGRPIDIFKKYAQPAGVKLLNNFIKISLWFGPVLLSILLIALSRIKNFLARKEVTFLDFSLIYVTVMLGGHFFLLAQAHGFPKYLYPVVPMLAVLISLFLKEQKIALRLKSLVVFSGLILLIAAYNAFVAGDMLYAYFHKLRYVFVFNPVQLKSTLFIFFCSVASYFLFIFLTFLIMHKKGQFIKSLFFAIIIVSISFNLSLDILQASAPYITNYYYGRSIQDMALLHNLLKAVRKAYPQGIIIGPEEASPQFLKHPWDGEIGHDPGALLKVLSDRSVVCIAYSLSWNSVATYQKVIFKPEVQDALLNNFQYCPIGEYSVWLRKR